MISPLDLNADLGETDGEPPAATLALLDLVTSVNIACGAHAGDATSMRRTVGEAASRGVQIGAHPSFPDREGFGRRVLEMTPKQIRSEVAAQVSTLVGIARSEGARVAHVKPHGALYNLAWNDAAVAAAIVSGIIDVDRTLALYAPPGSALANDGRMRGLRVIAEGFLDRTYEDDGTLTPRGVPGAVIDDADAVCARASSWIGTGWVPTRTGAALWLPIDTLCVHGDTPHAASIARRVRDALASAGVTIAAPLKT